MVEVGLAAELLATLRMHLDEPTLDYAVGPHSLGGTFSEVFYFELAGHPDPWRGPLVLRLSPEGASGEQTRIQAAVQNGLADVGFPAPRVLLVDDDLRISKRQFLIARHLPGRPFLRGVRPGQFAADFPRLLLSWGKTAARVQAQLHEIDPATVLDHLPGDLEPEQLTTRRHIERTVAVLDEFGGPGLVDAVGWLRDNEPPAPEQPSIVHGDFWPGNVLFERRQFSGLVDWDRAGIGDPALDVGFAMAGLAMMPAPFPPPPPIAQGIQAAGHGIARDLKRAYDRLRPLSAEQVAYYQALRCALELAVVVEHKARSTHERSPTPPPWGAGTAALTAHFRNVSGVAIELAT